MPRLNPRALASIGGRPIHAMLTAIPTGCFVGTFITDLAYWKTAAIMWADMSAWLLTVGLVVSILTVLSGLVDVLGDRRIRALRPAGIHGLGAALVVILSILNAFVHSRDAWTSVVPTGLILSGLVVLILVVTNWTGRTMVYRHGVGVRPEDDQ